MSTRSAFVALLAAFLCPATFAAQQPPSPTFGSGTSAVVVDVIVTDSKGRPVTDLRPEDFQVFEDGVLQEVADLALVSGGGGAPELASGSPDRPADTTPAAAPTAEAPSFVALVFDRLSPEARALAHKSALGYLDLLREHDFTGVFLSDLSLVTVHTFTNDRARLRAAIDDVASRATSAFDRLRIGPRGFGDPDPGTSPTAGPDSEGPAPGDPARTQSVDPALTSAMDLIAMTRRMERQFEAISRDQQGHATTNSLLAVIGGLGELPGRKTVILFAEGIAIPSNVQPHFQSVVAAANRRNVTLYSIDCAGLRVQSGQSETARRVNNLGSHALQRDPERTNEKLTEALELNEDVLRRDPAVSLRLLSEPTGGFVIDSTNDLGPGLAAINADRRFHYLLTYSPRNADFKGEWRSLTVKVRSRPVRVRARSGYLAVHHPGAIPMLAYEAPALAALERTPPPADISIRSKAFVFPAAGGADVVVLAAVDTAALAFEVDDRSGYRTDFTLVARVVDASGEVVRKASQPYRLTGPGDQLELARRGGILFFRQPRPLPPGRYTLEAAGYDALAGRAGVAQQSFDVPAAGASVPSIGSVVIVHRAERVGPAERDGNNPLYVGDVLLYPNLGEDVRRADKAITLFFTVLLPSGTQPTLTLDVMRGPDAVATLPVVLEKPDDSGRIQQLAQLPTAPLAPGEYTLRLTMAHGGQREVREATFRLVE